MGRRRATLPCAIPRGCIRAVVYAVAAFALVDDVRGQCPVGR
jgi:hypothetical protein